MDLRVFGTVTSPYVRRVRAVALELDQPLDWVDTATDAGQAALRDLNPLWKIPSALIDGQPVFDSRVIVDQLVRSSSSNVLAPIDPQDTQTLNVISAIDGVLDALINAFYLGKDGVTPQSSSYMAKHYDRAEASMAWLDAAVDEVWITKSRTFGIPEITLCTAVEWMLFRDTYPVEKHPRLLRCALHHGPRPSLVETRPPQ